MFLISHALYLFVAMIPFSYRRPVVFPTLKGILREIYISVLHKDLYFSMTKLIFLHILHKDLYFFMTIFVFLGFILIFLGTQGFTFLYDKIDISTFMLYS